MKTKLLLLLLFISSITLAQVPTTGLVGYYDFTNGGLLDQANGNNFTQTGTALTTVNDRLATANNAVQLNGDYLTRTDISISGTHTFAISYSFWVNTTTNNSNLETIIDDSTRNTVTHFDGDDTGYYIYLQDGKLRLTSRFYTRLMFSSPIIAKGYGHASNKFIADGNWHHVVVEFKTYIISGIQYVTSKFYIDTLVESSSATHNGIVTSPNTTGNVTIANSRTNHLTAVNQYKDTLDDIFVYNRSLTQVEVNQLANINGYCLTPNEAIITTNTITSTSATVSISDSGNFDVAYHKTSEPFSNATILSGVSSGSTILSGLDEFTEYSIYIRKQCISNTTGWSGAHNFATIRTIGKIYVNHAATGNNNGVSWTNAYTSLTDALLNMEANEEIWVAQGTYTPDLSDRDISFDIVDTGAKIYGGFLGTETNLLQRDFRTNGTILSGDLLANDDTTIEFSNSTRNDNSYNIITVNANNVIIDGFTISGAHANGSSAEQQSGGAIFKGFTINSLDVNNCIIKNNVSTTAAAAVYSRFDATGTLKIHNSEFNNNLSRYGTAIYSYTGNGFTADIEVANSLFYNNTAKNNGGTTGYAGSAGWFRAYGTGSTMNSTLINNTYYNNVDTGTASGLNNFNRATVGMGYISGTLNGDVANCIFWGNTTTGGVTSKAIAQIHTTLGQNITVDSSIDENSFSVIPPASITNSSSTDPLFTNTGSTDFTLQSGSPAIDAGNNSKIPLGIGSDILGNVRIHNTTVDMGVYEHGAPVYTFIPRTLTVNTTNGSVNIAPNLPGGVYNNGDVVTLTATPISGYAFVGWSGAVNGSTNPLVVTMDADKVITATFSNILYVDDTATGNNTGGTWGDAFTTLEAALNVATSVSEIWVAQGTYIPTTTNSDPRKATFLLSSDIKLYGGFNGTEITLSQRDPKTNTTILSGDLQADDNATLLDTEPTRQDNAYHIVSIRGNTQNVVIDGFTISGGNANGSIDNSCSTPGASQYYDIRGGAIYVNPYTSSNNITALFKDCILEKNTGTSVAVYSMFNPCGVTNLTTDVDFESCIVRDNYSQDLTAMLFSGAQQYNLYARGSIINSLFYNNTSLNNASCMYLGASTGGNATGSQVDIINTTFAKNIGTNGNVMTMVQASNSKLQNTIIYGNGSITPFSVTSTAASVSNSIIEGGQLSGTNSDPLFTDTVSNDFTLQSTSPAINAGNNSYIPASITLDLAGNDRVYATTVDLGAYESSTVCENALNIQVNNVTESTADITWNANANVTNWSVSFVENGQPTTSAVTIANITGTSYTITGLTQFTNYDIYVKSEDCTSINGWTNAVNTTTLGKVFVHANATGANNGTSWTDAFTKLEDALLVANSVTPIWVAAGTYIPSTNDANPRKATYLIPNGVKIYGGFSGIETLLSERSPKTNITILSGDLQADDNAILLDTEPTRQDNAYHVVSVKGGVQNIVVDGLTISGGNANGGILTSGTATSQYYETRGGAIFSQTYSSSNILRATFSNCILEKNTGVSVSVYGHLFSGGSTNMQAYVDFNSCIVRENYSQDLSTMLYSGNSFYQLYNRGVITNSLFHNNISNTEASCIMVSSSTYDPLNNTQTWGSSRINIINSTFSNNSGVNDKVIKIVNGDNLATFLRNSIVYGNGVGSPYDFNGVAGGITVQNTLTTDPLFVDATNNNFNFQVGSPAIDTGDNNYVTAGMTTDLAGNARIYNTTVDMGCYEYDPSLSIAIAPKVFLQGPSLNPDSAGLMNDNLRANGYIPTTSPYTDALTCNATVFTTTGNDAIVDWVFVELRDETDNTAILHSQSALLQRDGDVVATDGISSLSFNTTSGNYYVVIKHRNHLSIMSANAVTLSSSAAIVDFTNSASPITYGTNAQSSFGMQSGMLGMWAGNVGGDTSVRYQGSGNDTNSLKDAVLADIGNTTSSNLHSFTGYSKADVNLDGSSRYQGSGNDSNTVKDIMLAHPDNQSAPSNLFIILEQLPEN